MTLLTPDLLERIRGRAGALDAANEFFDEDLADLRELGYLRAVVPEELGGLGLSLRDVSREQRRLAAAAPATALGVNMHLIWTGVALTLRQRGDTSLDFVLREAVDGELFGFGISERGNDQMLFDSTTRAEPDADGGYRYSGTKIFTSLSPAWTRLGVHGRDDSAAETERLVFGFVERGASGVEVLDDWDSLGMRATHSNSTRLDRTPVRAERVVRRVPPGAGFDELQWAIFVLFELLLASVYAGLGDRAVELAIDAAKRRSRSDDPVVRARIADAAVTLDGVHLGLDLLTRELHEGLEAGANWFRQVSGLKVRAVSAAQAAVDSAIVIAGGSAFAASSELARLYRDVLAGVFQPSSVDSTRATVARDLLGPIPD